MRFRRKSHFRSILDAVRWHCRAYGFVDFDLKVRIFLKEKSLYKKEVRVENMWILKFFE